MKYILVTGGVISGVGKGIIASSLGVVLNSCGIRVSAIKIDPYINIDAGTFSPYEHGEVFVLDDGGEVDLDLGNYERFLGIKLHRKNNITTGKIYQQVIQRERRGDYLGKTVQVVPHITDAIQEWVRDVAEMPVDVSNQTPEVCIVELGGTIGDIEGMPFVEAFRQFQFRVKRENFMNVHVSLVPEPKCTGEQKTKPTQNSVRELRGLGLSPDLVFCRSETVINSSVRDKISNFCHVSPEQVICVHDVASTYHVPLLLFEQNVLQFVIQRLELTPTRPAADGLQKWQSLAKRIDRLFETVTIALVGKYVKLGDAYASVVKALQHAAIACDRKLLLKHISSTDLEEATQSEDPVKYHEAWQQLCSSDGVLVPGGFGERGIEGKIDAAGWARRNRKPFLGVCLGMQCAVIEFARNVLKLRDANSTEFNPTTTNPVVIEMPEHHTGDMGGTMRLGLRTTSIKAKDSVLRKLYGVDLIRERHRHRYEVNPDKVADLEKAGMVFVGQDVEEGKRMEIFELKDHNYYVGVQFHPEYTSHPLKPSPPYLGLILAAVGSLNDENIVAARNSSPMSPRILNGRHDGFPYGDVVNGDISASSPTSLVTVKQQKLANGNGLVVNGGGAHEELLSSSM